MVYKGNAAQVSLSPEDTSTQLPIPKSGDLNVDKGKGKQIVTHITSPTNTSQSPNSTPTTSSTQPPYTPPHRKATPCSQHTTTSIVTRWIPKSLLQAQQYSGGEGTVWLPRQPHHQKPSFPSPSKPRQRKARRTQRKRRTHQQWVSVPLLEGQGFYQGNDQIWVPK